MPSKKAPAKKAVKKAVGNVGRPKSPELKVPSQGIKSFLKKANPKNDIEKTLVIGYYVTKVATGTEKANLFSADHVIAYYKVAGYKLPNYPRQLMVNAKNAGNIALAKERGKYSVTKKGSDSVRAMLK